jgi:hypothetical protein
VRKNKKKLKKQNAKQLIENKINATTELAEHATANKLDKARFQA